MFLEFEASLVYIVVSRLAGAICSETLSLYFFFNHFLLGIWLIPALKWLTQEGFCEFQVAWDVL